MNLVIKYPSYVHLSASFSRIQVFRNEYDGYTIEASLHQVEHLTGRKIKILAGDRSYRRTKEVNGTKIMIPDDPKKSDSSYQKKKHKLFRKRARMEPAIGHLKTDHRLSRNFYKGETGDAIKTLLAATTYDFKRAMNALLSPY